MILSVSVGVAQNGLVETVRGVIVSGDPTQSWFKLPYMLRSDPAIGTITDEHGNFTFSVPVGRQRLRFSCMGFLSQHVDILVNTGKEVVLNITLEPSLLNCKTLQW